MKSIITIMLLAFAALVSSCNKNGDWKCTCDVDGTRTDMFLYDTDKKEAKSKCRDMKNNTNYDIKNCNFGKE